MKKILIFLMSFCLLGIIVYAQTPEEPEKNFQNVAQKELDTKEFILYSMNKDIEDFCTKMAENATITPREMRGLRRKIKKFDETKTGFDKSLGFYDDVSTATEVQPKIRRLIEVWFVRAEESKSWDYKDNEKEEIRRYFTEQDGYPIISVKRGPNYKRRFDFLGILLIVLIGCVVGFMVRLYSNPKRGVDIGVIASILALAVTLFS